MSMMRLAEAAKELSELQAKQSELESKLNDLLKQDPETISRLSSQRDEIKAQVNMWTDNIFILRQYITGKLGVSSSTINEAFSIPDDIDVID
jgi:peptidoglycan hydrolase CwlO-like protein